MYPEIFRIHNFPINTYGVFLALAFLGAIMVTVRLGARDGLPRERLYDLCLWMLLSSLVGSKLLMLFTEPEYRDHPGQPIIGTEMGSTVTTRGIYEKDSIRAYVPDQDITAPWWASTAETWWKLAAANDYWLGGFVWTGLDYRGEPTPYQWPNISSHFGIMDACGFPKNIYYYYQSWWTDKDVLHISPHWNWPGKEGQPIDV